MGGHSGPLTCCDRDCAGVNHCQMGGYQCDVCGLWFCGDEIDENGRCPDCAEEYDRTHCRDCGEKAELNDDGLCEPCAEEPSSETLNRREEKRLALIIEEVQGGEKEERPHDAPRDR